jgi:hypothetical protein
LVIAAVAVKEGREAWRGDACCAPGAALVGDQPEQYGGCTGDCCADER